MQHGPPHLLPLLNHVRHVLHHGLERYVLEFSQDCEQRMASPAADVAQLDLSANRIRERCPWVFCSNYMSTDGRSPQKTRKNPLAFCEQVSPRDVSPADHGLIEALQIALVRLTRYGVQTPERLERNVPTRFPCVLAEIRLACEPKSQAVKGDGRHLLCEGQRTSVSQSNAHTLSAEQTQTCRRTFRTASMLA